MFYKCLNGVYVKEAASNYAKTATSYQPSMHYVTLGRRSVGMRLFCVVSLRV